MNENDIRKYARLMTELELTGMEININSGTVRLERAPGAGLLEISRDAIPVNAGHAEENVSAGCAAEAGSRSLSLEAEAGENITESEASACSIRTEQKKSLKSITSPTVGIFYDSPTESSDAFVRVGDHVKKGEVLCIIEAMKLMNEIEAEEDGIIEEICIRSGEQVEYGTELFRIAADVA